ncbi:chromate transporter domain-containing protein [Trichoderma breve]|uniref:Chromate transporter domain-containing protein n=1 Tax=Trichoderma breve TaxID=2034170 RepID=A0A9W9B9H1_9HYPO|nr:chromate transporter domain-containing protein [Trichoderma breve]KAJ4858985.1 chromate transporter domain-containing protein [Trichoderma breve]
MSISYWEHKLQKGFIQAWPTIRNNWHLGMTAFGGPPVHFKIFHDKFVLKLNWIDEQMYQELFSVSQALSGPASTKMLYCVNLINNGLLGALLAFFIWSLPGALGMFGLSIGVSEIGSTLPRAVYALLSGLNAATVGIIALAAVELSNQAITDKLTRILVFLTGSAGMLYNALWYFPVLMFASGFAAVTHDYRWLHRLWRAVKSIFTRASPSSTEVENDAIERDSRMDSNNSSTTPQEHEITSRGEPESRTIPHEYQLNFSWRTGTAVIATFFLTFIVVMVLRGVLHNPPILYKLFANLYLAGTIIFGGGPVVIPLLREYVVAEGWVSPRDFLIGLAIIQAFPGPNFNFAVFLGGLTAIGIGQPAILGAIVAYLGIFLPGIVLVHGTMGVWKVLRSKPWVKSGVRGINAAAVGLIYTAVYRIWQVGYVDEGFQAGKSLGDDPWWVVVTATAYVGGRYFGLSAPLAILLGAVMGLVRYGVVMR